MSDSFREVTSVSWFGRIKRAVGGVIFGLILIVLMVIGLFWNEGRAVQTARSLAEGSGAVVSVGADSVDAANDGKLVHVSGPVTTDSGLADPDFGIAAQGLRLSRSVEMYQWKEESKSETTKKLGGGEETVTTYSYSKVWDDSQIDSSDFKKPDGHQNPSMAIHSRTFQIPQGKLVAFDLDTPVLDRVEGDKDYSLSTDQSAAIKAAYTGTKPFSIVDGKIYLGNDNTTPALGDYRVGYELAPLGVVSIVARQAGSRFEPYQTQAGDALLMVDTGNVPAEKMFADAVSANTLITWLLRGAGLLLLTIGFALFLSPIGVIVDVIPFLGSMARMGTGIIAFVLAILVGTTTIAIAWFWYRPLLAIGILAAGVIAAAAVYSIGRSRKPAVPVVAPSTGAPA
ncbi:TMEM43 family protein [Mesorhizobium caraganae]|uniref:TMEM43 family protein n=1 Tax=Mesorhizobium caraganae TaxID=483206 RepID=UPI001939328E|nr:TMEM43 family protein [Mesorhizobium caraganae]MBM2712215.1 TMEM43 family protein [Mesorhizobium caraganae]